MPSITKIFSVFLKIGFIAFGGPAAHAALLEQELVSRRKWIKPQLFLDFLGAVNLIPGPNSTQLTMLAGYQLKGIGGMLAAGFGFIIPAALITGILAWFYVSLGEIPAVESLFFGIKPAVIAVIAAAILQLGRKAMKNKWLGLLGLVTLLATLLFLNEITAILSAGITGMLAYLFARWIGTVKVNLEKKKENNIPAIDKNGKKKDGSLKTIAPFLLTGLIAPGLMSYSILKLFWVFFKIGAVMFGTGYVLVAYLDGELVEKLGWLSRAEILDAIAIGQFTPGPILSAATFVGYLLDGIPGATVATLAIFMPSLLFILILYPIIPKLRRSVYASAFLDSVNIAAVAVMLSVTILMIIEVLNLSASLDALNLKSFISWYGWLPAIEWKQIFTAAQITDSLSALSWQAALILSLALFTVFRFNRISSIWIIMGGAALGILFNLSAIGY